MPGLRYELTWTEDSIPDNPPDETLDETLDEVGKPTDENVGCPKLKAGNTTGSTKKEGEADIASIVNRVVSQAERSRAAEVNAISDDEWEARIDNKLWANQPESRSRMQNKLETMSKIVTSGDEGITSLGPDLGTPQPAEEHSDLQRWHEDEKQALEQEEKKREAAKYKAVLDKIADLEQQQTERAKENHKTFLTKIAKVDQQVDKKADKVQVAQQGRVFASFGSRIDKVGAKAARLETQYGDLSNKLALTDQAQRAMKTAIDANTQTALELHNRIHVLENPLRVRQVSITNLGAVAAAIAGAEQPKSNTGACDLKEVSALTAKTDGHDQRLERLEAAMGDFDQDMMDKAFQWFEWAGNKFELHDQYFNKVDEVVGSQEQQTREVNDAVAKAQESFEQKLRQQKEDSDKELSDCKKSMQEQMRLQETSIRKEYEERLASKDKEFAEHVAKTDAEQKQQNERHDDLKKTVDDILARLNAQNATQQSLFPGQGPQPPESHPPQPTPAPRGNGPWSSAPAPPAQGQPPADPDVDMGGAQDRGGVPNLDTEMEDAPTQTPQHPQPSQQHRPQPSRADTPMAFGDPMIPNNNGNVGFAPQPQPRRGIQPFVIAGPAQPPFQAPVPPAAPIPTQGHQTPVPRTPIHILTGTGPSNLAPFPQSTPTEKRGEPLQHSPFGSIGGGPKTLAGQKPLPDPMVTPARAPSPSKFGFNAPPPTVNEPKMDWLAIMESVDFDPPANLDIDEADMKPSRPKAQQPLANAAPATPSAGQPAANNAPSGKIGGYGMVIPNGSLSTAVGPTSTPAKPQTPAPTPASTKSSAPKPAKKKASPFLQRKPNATPSKPTETTSKAQTTQTKAASAAQMKQADFAAQYSGTPASKTTLEKTATPSEDPSAFRIPGLTYASKETTPAPAPMPASPAPKPDASPLANHAATSDTIESSATTNVFMKEVEQPVKKPSPQNGNSTPGSPKNKTGDAAAAVTEPAKPAENADDIQMSEAESKPEVPKAPKHESDVNPRKHAAEAQIVPQDDAKVHRREAQKDARAHKPEPQDDAKPFKEESPDDAMVNQQDSQGDDHMETDRRVIKPMGTASRLTAAQIQSTKDQFEQEGAWDAMDRAIKYQHDEAQAKANKAAAASADDEVDYGDPNDINDEDVHQTTMGPSAPPKVRPTKYSIEYFEEWKADFMSTDNLATKAARFDIVGRDELRHFIGVLKDHDNDNSMHELLRGARIPVTREAFSKLEMKELFCVWRDEVFYEAVREAGIDDHDPELEETTIRIAAENASWLQLHRPDAV